MPSEGMAFPVKRDTDHTFMIRPRPSAKKKGSVVKDSFKKGEVREEERGSKRNIEAVLKKKV